ncbi:MAG: hypothetical protein HY238_06685 [Acidobacteria bacterium]|nr:hypothetical protein [Acidobacteriota bacterium]
MVTLPAGTTLTVRTTLTLSSNTHQAGETFFATLQESLIADGWVIAAKGAVVEGQIEEVDKGGRFKGRAWLAVRLTGLHTRDGRAIRITSDSISRQGGAHQLGFVKRGAPAVLPADTLLNFRVLSPVTITEGESGTLTAKSEG